MHVYLCLLSLSNLPTGNLTPRPLLTTAAPVETIVARP